MKEITVVKQASFVAKYEPLWQEFDRLCQDKDETGTQSTKKSNKKQRHYPIVRLYRQICEHYALAKQRNYSPLLIDELHKRVTIGHRLIYNSKKNYGSDFVQFVIYKFPNAVRARAWLFWLCFAFFYLPAFVMGVACYLNSELIYSVMPAYQVSVMEEMYNPANEMIGRGADRQADTDLMMFGHYVQNNVGIDFQVYAMGVFFGIGSALITLYNGVVIGAVAGHLTGKGYNETFWQFVLGHGSFELTAIVIACMAGLRLGTPLIAPAPYSKKQAFLVAGRESIVLLLGAALMTFIAAFIEAFWSSSSLISPMVKYGVAALLWAFVAWYLLFCGKDE